MKRENKHSNGDLRITPCTRPVCGFTPREAVAMIMSCEGLVADPADSTDCPTSARRRDRSAAAAQRAHHCPAAAASPEEACTSPASHFSLGALARWVLLFLFAQLKNGLKKMNKALRSPLTPTSPSLSDPVRRAARASRSFITYWRNNPTYQAITNQIV